MKRLSLLYGGGSVPKDDLKEESSSAPLSGDPMDDLIARLYAEGNEEGFTNEEIQKRLQTEPEVAVVTLTDSYISINGISLGRLNPSVRAFYILVARHPEGIEKEKDPKGLVKDSFCKYLDEYMNIQDEMKGIREKKVLDKSEFNIDSRFPRYRDTINNAITRVEEDNHGLNLSSCKVFGTGCWKITARVIDQVNLHTVPEL